MDEIREDAAGEEKLEQLEGVSAQLTRIRLEEDQSELWI